MHHAVNFASIELVTGISYLLILLGFGLRSLIEGRGAKLLWPWMLVSIFGLCGLTRLDYVGVVGTSDLVNAASHFALAALSLSYGVGQLLYACWPELFEQDTGLPQLARDVEPAA